jgi:hypothetical protein
MDENVADDGGPSAAEVKSDQELAVKVTVGALTGIASAEGPDAAIAAQAAAPVIEAMFTAAIGRLGRRRVERAAETLTDAAEAAKMPLQEFMDNAVSDDRRQELFARTLTLAQDTALRSKRRALGRALAAGVVGDDARIDDELLFIRAVADIDTMHIRLLDLLQQPDGHQGWSYKDVVDADPGLAPAARALLGTLELHGLVASRRANRVVSNTGSTQIYTGTCAGDAFLRRLANDADG